MTLEPCSHHGRTGPCAEALVKAGVETVVVAALDPNPLVAGRGIAILQDAGIQVITGVLEQESILMNEVFNHFIEKKKNTFCDAQSRHYLRWKNRLCHV
ncbi:hypothetical protein BsIDN1_68380 [Bacillus safensis]|uniref:CMP/dCMP-type deaminase domain-containing protein n=1 Tax=Bacillus safensis TaxID=561879 RepID=A0A5S9MIG0_BACIA|nr:hypothetical protein BsIDN1_68380 [Bacillus safensis]